MNRKASTLQWLCTVVMSAILVSMTLSTTAAAQGDITIEPGGIIGGFTGAAGVQGDYAFINQGTVLTVMDVSGDNFDKAASLILGGEPIDLVVVGDRLYVFNADPDSALQIIDISDPLQPSILSTAAIPGSWRGKMHVSGDHVYIALMDSLEIVDVSDVIRPSHTSTIPIPANAVWVRDSLAYVAENDGMRIYNMGQNDSWVEIANFPSGRQDDIIVQGDHAFLAGQRTEWPPTGVHILDISNPQEPTNAGFFATHVDNAYYVPDILAIDGNTICAGGGGKLFVGDITDPTNPIEQGVLNIEIGAFPSILDIDIQSPFAYVVLGASSYGFVSIDLSDPNDPVVADRLQEPWDVKALFTKGDTAYIASMERLWIFSFGDPAKPVLLGSDTTWTELSRLTVAGQYLYGLWENEMLVIDVADPGNMFQVGSYRSDNDMLREVSVHGDKAYLLSVGEGQSILEIVDVSDFENITQTGVLPLPGEARDLFMPADGNVAYIAYSESDANQGFQIIDVSDASAPTVIGGAQAQGKPISICSDDTLTFVASNADSSWFLESFSVAAPDAPTRITGISGPDAITDILTIDSLVVASLPNGSAHVFDRRKLDEIVFGDAPESVYIAAIWFSIINGWGLLTLNGYLCTEAMYFSGSWGLFYMFLRYSQQSAVDEKAPQNAPYEFSLEQNYPNPFNPKTTIQFNVNKTCHVKLDVFDVRGRHVTTLVDERKQPGAYEVHFDADAGAFASGVYFYQIQMGNVIAVRKMTLLE